MVMERVQRGLERTMGPVTLGMMMRRATQALESYRDEGKREVTAHQIRERMEQQHTPGILFPIANGNLPGALSRMEEGGKITAADKDIGVRKIKTYSLAEQPTPEATAIKLQKLLERKAQMQTDAAFLGEVEEEEGVPEELQTELDLASAQIKLIRGSTQ